MNDSNTVKRNLDEVGQNIAKFRDQMGWTKVDLAAKLRLLGCNITHQILADIEKQCCVVTDAQIAFFAPVDVSNNLDVEHRFHVNDFGGFVGLGVILFRNQLVNSLQFIGQLGFGLFTVCEFCLDFLDERLKFNLRCIRGLGVSI
jgi:hypothetical protein